MPAPKVIAMIAALAVMCGSALASPAASWPQVPRKRPLTRWLPGETKPEPSSPTALSSNAAPATPSAGLFPTLPALKLLPTTPTASSEPTSAPVVAPPASSVAPTVSVRSRLERDNGQFHLGEKIRLIVELSWVGEPGDVLPESPEEPALMNLTKRGMIQSSRMVPQSAGHAVVMTYLYELEPAAEGAAAIEPIEIRYRLRGSTDRLHLTTDRHTLTILPRRKPWGKIIGWTAAVLAAAGILAAGGMAIARRVKRAREAARVPPPPSPFEQMSAELDGVRKMFTQGVVKDGYDAIERFVRKALGLFLKSDFRHPTITELTERLAHESLDERLRDRAASILDRCMQVKFAGYTPTVADQEQVIADCRTFLEAMKEK